MTDLVLASLSDRRKFLLAELHEAEVRLHRVLADIGALDATILQFDAAYRPTPVRASHTTPGLITRTVLVILRKAAEPMTLRQVTLALMEALGLDRKDRKRVKKMMEQTRTALARQITFGVVVKEKGPGLALVWRVVG